MDANLRYKVFRSSWNSWDTLFQEACDFADSIGRENVLNISHSCHNNEGVVTVWFWQEKNPGRMFELNQVNFGE